MTHHLRISRTLSGFYINSNGRTVFFDFEMTDDLLEGLHVLLESGRDRFQNYEEAPRRTFDFETAKPGRGLADLLSDIGLNGETP